MAPFKLMDDTVFMGKGLKTAATFGVSVVSVDLRDESLFSIFFFFLDFIMPAGSVCGDQIHNNH